MDIDWDGLLLAPLHAGMGVDAEVEPAGAAPFTARVMRHYPSADLPAFAGSQVAANLYVYEVRSSVWAVPAVESSFTVPKIGRLRVQSVRPDEKQPGIWLLDCFPDA